jgi:hypothetical protein
MSEKKIEDVGQMKSDKRYDAVCETIKGIIRSAEVVFGLHPTEIACCLGSIMGEYIACEDDYILHDKEIMARLKEDCKKKGITEIPHPCLDSYHVNFKYAYKKHLEEHNEARKCVDKADAMLEKVCESHRKRG